MSSITLGEAIRKMQALDGAPGRFPQKEDLAKRISEDSWNASEDEKILEALGAGHLSSGSRLLLGLATSSAKTRPMAASFVASSHLTAYWAKFFGPRKASYSIGLRNAGPSMSQVWVGKYTASGNALAASSPAAALESYRVALIILRQSFKSGAEANRNSEYQCLLRSYFRVAAEVVGQEPFAASAVFKLQRGGAALDDLVLDIAGLAVRLADKDSQKRDLPKAFQLWNLVISSLNPDKLNPGLRESLISAHGELTQIWQQYVLQLPVELEPRGLPFAKASSGRLAQFKRGPLGPQYLPLAAIPNIDAAVREFETNFLTVATNDGQVPVKRTILLHGPTGTGKSALAYALGRRAQEAGCDFFTLRLGSMVSKYFGESLLNLATFFEELGQYSESSAKPVLLFLDELEHLLAKGSHSNEASSIVNGMLRYINPDRTGPYKKLFIIGVTNCLSHMADEAVERFANKVFLGPPTRTELKASLEYNTGALLTDDNASLLAWMAQGLTHRDVVFAKDIARSASNQSENSFAQHLYDALVNKNLEASQTTPISVVRAADNVTISIVVPKFVERFARADANQAVCETFRLGTSTWRLELYNVENGSEDSIWLRRLSGEPLVGSGTYFFVDRQGKAGHVISFDARAAGAFKCQWSSAQIDVAELRRSSRWVHEDGGLRFVCEVKHRGENDMSAQSELGLSDRLGTLLTRSAAGSPTGASTVK